MGDHLLQDLRFENGFRAAWNYGKDFTISNELKKGDCVYESPKGYQISGLPNGGDQEKYWEMNTGVHEQIYMNDHRFEVLNDVEGWYAGNGDVEIEGTDGALVATVKGPDPFIYSPILSLSSNYNAFRINLTNTTIDRDMQLFWITEEDRVWNQEKSVWIRIDNKMATSAEYYVDLSMKNSWSGTIRQLRLDPVNQYTHDGKIRVFSIRIGKDYPITLHDQNFEVNPVVAYHPSKPQLWIGKYNNDGLEDSDPSYNQKMMYCIDSNMQGTIKIYQNTKNEIRNIATAHSAEFQNDTWPHLNLMQNLRSDVDMAKYNEIWLDMNLKLEGTHMHDGWPKTKLKENKPGAYLMTYVFLREKRNPLAGMFFGLTLYSNAPEGDDYYAEQFNQDQYGQGIYRTSSANYGGKLEPGVEKHIRLELKSFVRAGIAFGEKTQNSSLSATSPDDYQISIFYIGWECRGFWETSFILSDLSMIGTR